MTVDEEKPIASPVDFSPPWCGEAMERLVKKNENSICAKVDEVNWLSFISFSWVFGYLWNAYKRRVDPNQTFVCSIYDSSTVNAKRLELLWNDELKLQPDAPSLFRVVLRFMKGKLILACMIFLLNLIFGFIGPTCLIRRLIAFTENPPVFQGEVVYSDGAIFVFGIVFVEVTRVLMYGATWAVSQRTGIRVRGALLALLYKHLINTKSLCNRTPAEIVNLYANDGQRIFDAVTFAPLVLVGPFVLFGGAVYLLKVIGPYSLLGIGVFFAFDAVQAFLGIKIVRCRNAAIKETEARMGLMGEIIKCIRVIKMNVWEYLFIKRIIDIREREEGLLRTAGYAQSLAIASGAIVPVVATFVTVTAVVLSGDDLSASDAFSMITVFFVMLFGVRMIPYGMRYLAESRSAIQRIQELLLLPTYDAVIPAPASPNVAIAMKRATFTWDVVPQVTVVKPEANGNVKLPTASSSAVEEMPLKTADSPKFALKDLNVIIEKKQLIGVCGTVGSGKTALLHAILGHMSLDEGELAVGGTTAFVDQNAFVMNTTVRRNILFTASEDEMNTQRYYKAITCAQLTKDLESMPANELSEIGERGTTLSGGQKMRISIARALYSNRDIYLFDDIFASVDKNVADKIFQLGVKEMLSNKTILMVTASEEYLKQCDKILFFDDGRIVDFDTHDNLLTKSELYQNFFVSSHAVESHAEPESGEKKKVPDNGEVANRFLTNGSAKQNGNVMAEKQKNDKLAEEEENFGLADISWKIYAEYINAAGGRVMWAVVLLGFVANVGSGIFSTYWLSKWMKDVHKNTGIAANRPEQSLADNEDLSYYTRVYALLMVALLISGTFKAIIFVKVTLAASTRLHNKMLTHIVHALTWFFDTTPSGRILNRFSKDLDEIDVKLPFSAEMVLQSMITCIGFLAVISWVFPLFLVACVPLFCAFAFFYLLFRAGVRSLKRIENKSRSPVFERVSFSLDGLPTIHSYGQTAHYIHMHNVQLDENSGAFFMFQSAMRCQAVWLDFLVVAVTSTVSLLIVALVATVSPSDAGMAIAFAMQMSGVFQFAVRSQIDVEAKLTAVERISYYYKNVEQEPVIEDPVDLPVEWPVTGDIAFDNVVLSYHKGREVALRGVTFNVKDGEKVGIVGRTGSGKSSLCNALFRLYPLDSGRILIGQRDVAQISFERVRRAMAIIPQDPVLFSGTLRFNIDPENKFSDADIWRSVETVGLRDTISGQLDLRLEESGRNLSSGERQLVCMARALLRKVKIVVLDEATANIDALTDERLQSAMRETFADRTVLLITHRLSNVDEVDRIITVDGGKVSIRDSKSKSPAVVLNSATNDTQLITSQETIPASQHESKE